MADSKKRQLIHQLDRSLADRRNEGTSLPDPRRERKERQKKKEEERCNAEAVGWYLSPESERSRGASERISKRRRGASSGSLPSAVAAPRYKGGLVGGRAQLARAEKRGVAAAAQW